jgi:transposase InsO family protein
MGNSFVVKTTMPWKERSVFEQRREFVVLASYEGSNLSRLCKRYGISRKTGYKWLLRASGGGEEALQNRSRRPRHSPRRSAPALEAAVLELRERHPAWGGRKIAHVLARDRQLLVAPSTVTHILHRHGRIGVAQSQAATPWQRFEHEAPNELWQMDFKGHFPTLGGRCHPLTVVDDHSRYNLVLQACADERRETVWQHLLRCFERYGLPRRIQTDNGAPWGCAAQGPLTQLGVRLIRLGIRLSHTAPAHPQSNGKDERFHRSLKAEVLGRRVFRDLEEAQAEFDSWRSVYNHERPHEGIGMQTPAQRYRPSSLSMPASLPPIEYASGDQVRKVHQGGWLHFQKREVKVSKALAGQPVALRPNANEDGLFEVFFCHQRVASFHLAALK